MARRKSAGGGIRLMRALGRTSRSGGQRDDRTLPGFVCARAPKHGKLPRVKGGRRK
jgi:ribosomal protein L39E